MIVMANLTLELNINSASNLTNVNLITKMEVYAVVSIHGNETQKKKRKVKTDVDRSGGTHPTWNHAVKFPVDERLARDGRLTLAVRLISRRVLRDKNIGGVNVPLLELLYSIMPSINGDGNDKGMTFVTYQVKSTSGKRRGSLTFSYRFDTSPIKPDFPAIVNRRSVDAADSSSAACSPPSSSAPPPSQVEHSPSAPSESSIEYPQLPDPPCQINSDDQNHPVVAGSIVDPLPVSYGAGSSPNDKSGYAYHHTPPPQSSYAYFAPPAPSDQGYGPYDYAPSSPAGYLYGSPSSQSPEDIKLGLGLGVGLLGGLIVGDIVSDVANCFDL